MRETIRVLGVVVPAHDEQGSIRECLASIRASTRHLYATLADPPTVRVVVVLDACTDSTGRIVDAASDVECLRIDRGNVGAARAAGAEHLLRRCGTATRDVWLANTDADSAVSTDWLAGMAREANAGANIVLGTVIPQGLPESLALAWHRAHLLRSGHRHVHGANFGIRSDTYLALGGWTALETGEDVLLAARAKSAPHLHIVRTAGIPVCTSARTTGRAPHGFAAYLHHLSPRKVTAQAAASR